MLISNSDFPFHAKVNGAESLSAQILKAKQRSSSPSRLMLFVGVECLSANSLAVYNLHSAKSTLTNRNYATKCYALNGCY